MRASSSSNGRYDDSELRRMTREELNQLLDDVLFRLRQMDSEDIQNNLITKSQTVRLKLAKEN
jgi:ribosomal protein L29